MGTLNFLTESLRNLKTVGTITRSSSALCRGAIKPVNFATARNLVELGAGDGVITKHILRAMHPDARLMVFEVNEAFCEQLRDLNDPRLTVVEGSAEHLEHFMSVHNFDKLDAVISAIPFVSLPKELAYDIVGEVHRALRPGAPYTQVHYSLIMKPVYEEIFGEMQVDFIPLNLPPAFVLHATKKECADQESQRTAVAATSGK